MVRIAVAGGSGELAREVIDVLVATRKHEITILARNASSRDSTPHVSWRDVDYDNTNDLADALRGIHTVLSFVNHFTESLENNPQKNLIDAAIAAGVKRFAPSEYGWQGNHVEKGDLPFWAGKRCIKEYLERVNENGKVLEYTLFQPGLFMDYLASPHKTAKYVTPLDTFIDIQNARAIVVQGHEDAIMTLTRVQDIAAVVSRAVDYDGEWPRVGGIRGNRVTVSQIIEMGEKVRGRPFTVDKVKIEDLKAGDLKTSWILGARHPSFAGEDAEQLEAMLKTVMVSTLLSSAKGAWDVSDAFNKILPDFEFAKIHDFLAEVWEERP